MINLSNVSFSYGSENNLKNVSLNIQKGECVLLCGESGCGKTTITRLINGLIPYFYSGNLQGNITIYDLDTQKADIARLSNHVGSVFQNPRTQFFNIDTDSEIVFGLENKAVPKEELKEKLLETIKELDIEHLQSRSIFELSGGEKQKIAFASVYTTNPDIFVLDEPSSNLDKKGIIDLANLLSKVKSKGKTIVVSEHRIWYLMDIVDRVIFMKNGTIAFDVPIEEFKSFSEDEIVKKGLRARYFFEVKKEVCTAKLNNTELAIENLSVNFDEKKVLNKVNFSVKGGEILGIVGGNGVGKTTLLRTICGLQKQVNGRITLDQRCLCEKERKRKSYMVMQDVNHQLFTESVEAECRLGIKDPNQVEIEKVLKLLNLVEVQDKHPLSLSGGQKQRLAVAVSLLCEKEIIVFDEPTSGLDLKSMKEVSILIKMLSEQGKIVIIITHDDEFIASVCSKILRLEKGAISVDI